MPAPATLHFRPPIERLRDLAARLRAGKVVNAGVMAKDWEMCPKTMQRDLDFLRDRLGYEVEWNPRDTRGRTWVLTRAPEPQL